MNVGLDVEVIGEFNVVYVGREDFVDISRRGEQTDALQTIENVDFGCMLPLAFGFDGRAILLRVALALNRVRSLDGQLGEFLFMAGILQIVAPQAGLRLEANVIAEKIAKIGYLAEDKRRQPKARLHVHAPAIEVKVIAVDAGDRSENAVEANCGVVLILD